MFVETFEYFEKRVTLPLVTKFEKNFHQVLGYCSASKPELRPRYQLSTTIPCSQKASGPEAIFDSRLTELGLFFISTPVPYNMICEPFILEVM